MPLWCEPLALWSTLVLVETDKLGVVVVNFAIAYSNYGSTTRLVTGIVVQAHLAQSRHAHLL